ncbi:MAG: peptide chain release factor-like protein [Pirellulales bacterium]|nr:peptide chain release factor-like protein [Pirellulales bacterium]
MPPYDHPAALPPDKLLEDCSIQFVKRSGPGGQHRNKVSTGVVLVHCPTGVMAEAAERRSQAENRAAAMFRLRVNLALEIRRSISNKGAADNRTIPSPLWQSRCRGGRIEINTSHADFPTLLAEALDTLAAKDFDPRRAAEMLGCSASQLIKLLKKEPQALAAVNAERRAVDLHLLR